jgi:hypothetical protein
MAALLEAFVQHGEMNVHDVERVTGWSIDHAAKATANAKTAGYLAFVGEKVGNQAQAMALTELGRFRAGVTETDPRSGPESELAEKAAALILSTEGGMDSDALADALGCSSFDVEKALAASAKRFVKCRVMRGGDDFVHYRESASSPRAADNVWRKTHATAPAPAPRAPGPGVDIDAVHSRRPPAPPHPLPPIELDSVTQSSETEELPADIEQFFSLYSSGELLIQRAGGEQVFLDRDETRALFQWLDRLGGTHLERLTAPQGDEVPA